MTDTYFKSKQEQRAGLVIWVLSLFLAALLAGMISWKWDALAKERTQAHLAEEVLRFHVLANSDSIDDQALKMQVKETVLSYLEERLPESLDVDGTKNWVKWHTDELEQVSGEVIKEAGYDYPVSVAVTTCYFPKKRYGDVTFPEGNYTALRIEIGEAKGHNWWCVLYPNLCFMDAVHAVVPEEGKQLLKNVLAEDEYDLVIEDAEVKIKWYLPELMGKIRGRNE